MSHGRCEECGHHHGGGFCIEVCPQCIAGDGEFDDVKAMNRQLKLLGDDDDETCED